MQRHLKALTILVLLPSAAWAQAALTSADVVPAPDVATVTRCIAEAPDEAVRRACLDRDGIPLAARAFADRVARQSGLGYLAVLTDVTELGPVDLATAILPEVSATERQAVLVNGTPRAMLLAELVFTPEAPATDGTAAIRGRHPEATETSRPSVVAHRVLPDGGQRLVVLDPVADGCRDCAVVGVSVAYVDLMGGALVTVRQLGWMAPLPDEDEISARLQAGDIATVQQRLTLLGYDAGPADGVTGPRTRAAFYALKRDLCLAENPRILPVVPALSRTSLDSAPAPCGSAPAPAP